MGDEKPLEEDESGTCFSTPTDYFTPAEFCENHRRHLRVREWRGGRDFEHRALRLRALIFLMRWSGLSILDSVTLERRGSKATACFFIGTRPSPGLCAYSSYRREYA